jgi:hypothetical protein
MSVGLGATPIVSFNIVLHSATYLTPPGTLTAVDYSVILKYRNAAGTGYVTLTANNPIPDSGIGHVILGVARSVWAAPWRFAVEFQCSTWDGSAYAFDGFARLYLNGSPTPLLSAENVKIPMRFTSNSNLRYSIAPFLDADRIWARALPTVLPTDADGQMNTPAAPWDLIFFEDFDGGLYPAWTEFTFSPGFPTTPYPWSDSGGGGSWGVGVRCSHPSVYACAPGLFAHSFAGLYREASSDVPEPPPTPPSPPACVHGCVLTDPAPIAGGGQGCRLGGTLAGPDVECA